MSSKKKSQMQDVSRVESTFDTIMATISRLKSRISSADPSILTDLPRLFELIESLPGSKSVPPEVADGLDAEGVALWNLSTTLRPSSESSPEKYRVFAFLRLTGYLLIEAGMETKPDADALIRILLLVTKTASSLAGCGELDHADKLLTRAAKFEEMLGKTNTVDSEKSKAASIVSFFSTRMEMEWRRQNESVAFHMLGKASDNALLCNISVEDVELLASKTLDIGISILKAVPSGASNPTPTQSTDFGPEVALEWLQGALLLIETAGKEGGQNASLRRATLRGLARAHFLNSETSQSSLDGAEEAISELMQDTEMKSEEIQQLRWMSLSILKRRKVSNPRLEAAFKGIIDNVAFTDVNVTDILQEIGILTDNRPLVSTVFQLFLARAIDSENNSGHPFVARIITAQIFMLMSSPEESEAIDNTRNSLKIVSSNPNFTLDKVSAAACQSLLFQHGGKCFQAKQYLLAAEWFKLTADPVFEATSEANLSKCLRKTALCYIQAGQYALAADTIAGCPGTEAATRYVSFLCFVNQGLEEDAIRTITEMVAAPDFDRKMLLLATKLAHEHKMRSLLLSILEHLLSTLSSNAPLEAEVEALILLRCTIRVIIELLNEPEAKVASLLDTLTRHLHTAVELVKEAESKKSASVILKDVSWLWRIVYNTGIEGCKGWDPFQVSELFLLSRQLMLLYRCIDVAQADTELEHLARLALFSSICCRVFGLRQLDDHEDTVAVRRTLRRDIKTFRDDSKSTLSLAEGRDAKLEGLLNLSFVLDVEQICLLREWDDLRHTMESMVQSPYSVSSPTFEAIVDLIWVQQSCPTSVLYATLEAILTSTANRGQVGPEKFSRWLRAVVKILLARARESDRQRALSWIRHAIDVMRCGTQESPYPKDEQQYMLATCFNVGLECLKTSRPIDDTRSWFESAIQIARTIPGSEEQAKRVEEQYRELLARYTDRQS